MLKALIVKSHCTIEYHPSPAANPINSFKDVLENGDIKVITVKGSSYESNLKSSAEGTAKRKVYKTRIEPNKDVLYSSLEEAKEVVLKEPNTYLFAHDSSARTRPGCKTESCPCFQIETNYPISQTYTCKPNSKIITG